MSRRLTIVLALLIMLLGSALRFYKLSSQSFWTDEVYSLITSRVPLDRIVEESAGTNNSLPTYFLLLRWVVGDSTEHIESRARLISVLAGSLSIPVFIGVVYFWRRRVDVALAAGLLLAINPLHLWYSQETRAYAVMLFFGLLSLLFFEMARQTRRAWWWAAYFISSLLAIALHKTAIIFPAVCFLWQAWQLRRERGRTAILLIHVAIFVIAVGALSPKSFPPAPEYGRRSTGLELLYTLVTYVGGYSFGPSLTEIQTFGPMGAVLRNEAELAVTAGLLSLIALAYARRIRSLISNRAALLLFLDLAMVSGYAAMSSFPYNVRYTLPALLGFVALIAELVCNADQSYLAPVTLAAVAAGSLWADWQWYYSPTYRKEDSRAVAQWLIDNENNVKSWTVVPGYSKDPLQWYLVSMGHAELSARLEPARANDSTSFPPFPDVLIVGRRDRIVRPDAMIAAYGTAAGNSREVKSVTGFDVFTRDPIDLHLQ